MKISKATFDLLPETLKSAFKVDPTNADQYDNGEESAPELKTALAKEKEEKARVAQERDALKNGQQAIIDKARKDALEEARKSGDFAAIEADYKRQLAEAKKATETATAERNNEVCRLHQEKVAGELGGLFVAPGAMRPYVNSRIKVEFVDGVAVTRVLDAQGKPTAATLDDFRKEIVDNPEFKGILVASKGSGGGATQPTGGGGSTTGTAKIDAATAKPADMVAYLEAKGVGQA